jgi:hypothetical protein
MKIIILTLMLVCCASSSKYFIFMEVDENSNESDSNESKLVENLIIPSLLTYKKDKQGINYKDCGIKHT